jgi:hypothetical protein
MDKMTIKKGNIFIKDVPGIDITIVKKLSYVGIETMDDLQNACSTPQKLKSLADKTGIPEKLLGSITIKKGNIFI